MDPELHTPERPSMSEQVVTSSRAWLELRDIMSRNLVTVSPEETVVRTAQIMAVRNISCVIIVEKNQPIGILTERDLLQKVVAKENNFDGKKVRDIMTSPVLSAPANMSIFEASDILEKKKMRRLTIVENGLLIGIVTQTDLTRVLASYGMWRTIGEIMNENVSVISQESTVSDAATLMASRNISCVVITKDNQPVGILTERDMIKKIIAMQQNPSAVLLKDAMSSPILSVQADQSIFGAIKLIEEKKIRRIVVMDGPRLRGIVTQTDIFKSVKRKLEEEEAKHIGILERSENSIFTVDLKGITTYVNKAFVELLGLENANDLLQHPFLPERFWIDPKERTRLMGQLHQTGGVEIKELVLCSAKNKKIYATLFSTFTKNIHGEVNGYQGVLYNITEKKELVALREAEGQLRRSNEMLQHLNELKSDFVSMVSHELRAPMTIVRGRIDLVLSKSYGAVNEEQEKSLKIAIENIDRLMRIINNLLDLSKIEAGKLELKGDWMDLTKAVQFTVSSFLPQAQGKNIELLVETPEKSVVYADEDRIIQVISNLVNNGLKFTEKGSIKISVTDHGESFECSVTDTGSGIPEDEIDKIFGKFNQSKRPALKTVKGTGLGLSIAQDFVKLHGGKIWVTSSLGKGSSFCFTLPKVSVQEVFLRAIRRAIHSAVEKDASFSMALLFFQPKASAGPGFPDKEWNKILRELKTAIEDSFRRGEDSTVQGDCRIMILLSDCHKTNAEKALERFRNILQKHLDNNGLSEKIQVSCRVSTYPDNGSDAEELLEGLIKQIGQ